MRRTANSGGFVFDLFDARLPADAASSKSSSSIDQSAFNSPDSTSSGTPGEHAKFADTTSVHSSVQLSYDDATGHTLDGGSVTETTATDGAATHFLDHFFASDDELWTNDSSPNQLPNTTSGAINNDGHFVFGDNSPIDSVPWSEPANHPADAGSFHSGSIGTIVSDLGENHSNHDGGNDTGTPYTNPDTPPQAPSETETTPAATSASLIASNAQSGTPVLMWSGDLGSYVGTSSGTSGSSGTASSGSTGSVVQSDGSGSGLIINVDYDASVANAPAGFTAAVSEVVSYYESHFSNPITITIDVGYGEIQGQALESGALGESETALTSVSYSQLENALVTNADTIGDTSAAASLSATSPVSGAQYWMATAEAEALGISGASASVNGYVGFSSTLNFAYNDSTGVAANQYDFFDTVAHEFSEVMGRQMFDGGGGNVYEPLDLFHYSAPGVHDFSGTTAGYFSANGGTTNLGSFNTNPNGDFGDWASSVGANSYLAFTGSGAVDPVTANDLTEMNVLGWDPATSGTAPTVTVALAHDTSGTNNITSNDALTGTADANATVTLSEGSTVLGTTTANASGAWSFTPSGLAQGSQTITASETNAAGLTGSSSLTFTYVTAAPTVTVALAHDTGGTNNITSNDALTGTADANATVTLSEGSTVLGTTTANASGAWSFTPSGLAQGSQTITASETNAAGLTGSSSLTFTYVTAAPTVTVALAHDTGGTNNITSNDALTGTADANATVTLSEGSTVLGTTTANASGVWSFTPSGLAQGSQTITASETNAAGLTGSSSLTFTYVTAAPTVTVALAHDTGGTNNITSNDALTGTADANATVTLSEGSTVLGTTTANASGAWSFTPSGLAQGSQTITASETNAAGLTGSSSLTFTYVTAAPTVTVALAHDTGGTNNITSNDALTGTADANATVTLSQGATVLGSTTANASGVWSFTPSGLAQGSQTITASETNAAGLTGSSSLTFTYDTTAPGAPVIATDTVNGNNSVTLGGTAQANATVTVYEAQTVLGTAIANASGAWNYTTAPLTGGSQNLTATATDAAGNTSAVSNSVDPVIPQTTAPVVTSVVATGSGITAGVGDVYAGEVVTLTVNLSQAVSVAGGTPTLTLNDGGTATYTGGSGSNALNFSYTVAAGQSTPALAVTAVNLNGATVTNSIPTTVTASSGGSLTDANGHVWSFSSATAGGGNVILRDGVQFAGGSGETLALVNGVIWTENSGNKWYEATATGWIQEPSGPVTTLSAVSAGQTANLGGVVTTLPGPLQVDIATTTGPVVTSVVATGSGITAGVGDVYAGEVVTLTVNLSQAVSVAGGTPTLTLNDGGTATYTGGSGSNALNFSYTVAAGQSTPALAVTAVNLNGATVTNSIPTTVTASSGGSLTDANGHVWSFSSATAGGGNVILRDGVQFAGGSGETLALVNGVIWTENSGNKWYEATATGWIQEPSGPVTTLSAVSAGQTANLGGVVTTLPGPLQVDIATTTGPVVTSVVATGSGITAGVGDVYAGEVVTLTVNLSQAVSVAGGTPTLTLNDGGTATYTGGSGSNALNFSYTVAAGQSTPALAVTAVNLNGATVTNSIPTTVTASSGGSLTDANGHVWSFSATHAGGGNVILRDGVQFAGGSGETLTLVNGVIWTENSGNKWYEATATGWIQEPSGPATTLSTVSAGQAANLGGAVTTLSGPLQVDIATTTSESMALATTSVAYSDGMTEASTYNTDNTLHEVVYQGIAGQHYTSTDTLYGANNSPISEAWSNGATTIQTETWNSNGAVNNIHSYGITGQPYTDYDVVYGANNQPANATYSNGMTETWSYNSDNTLHEIVYQGITGQNYTSTDTVYGANNTPASEVWSNGTTTIQTETWNPNGTVNNIHYYGVTGQAYTDYDVVYGANNEPASATYSNGMTETWSYNSDNTLHEVVEQGITGQNYTSTDTIYSASNNPVSEVWSNGSTVVQTETWNANGTVLVTAPGETYVTGAAGSSISGGIGSNVLDGSAGNMTVTAGIGGAQTLIGGAGDTLNGGGAADTFIFPANLGNERVNNFETAHDVIELPAAEAANFAAIQADMHAAGADTVITLDAHDSITLSNVAAQHLTAQNFHFMV